MEENEFKKNADTVKLAVNLTEGQNVVIPLIQEQISIDKKTVESGTVRISKTVHEEESVVDTTIASDEVTIERREINQYVDTAPPAVRQEGDTTIISVLKEVLVIEKRLMLVEELHVKKSRKQQSVPVTEMLRKEEINITRTDSGTEF